MTLDQQPTQTGVSEMLLGEHAALERVFAKLTSKLLGGDREQAREAWEDFERRLRAHLQDEESHFLPAFERFDPEAAAVVRNDHESIRRALDQLGIDLDLHTIRHERVSLFVKELREHAQREEQGLYRWSEASVPPPVRRAIAARTRGTLTTASALFASTSST